MNPHMTTAAFARHALDLLPMGSLFAGWPPGPAAVPAIPPRLPGAAPLVPAPPPAPEPAHRMAALAG